MTDTRLSSHSEHSAKKYPQERCIHSKLFICIEKQQESRTRGFNPPSA